MASKSTENVQVAGNFRKYTFPTKPIPRHSIKDPETNQLISAGKPVILTDTNLVAPALANWTIPYLEENIGSGDFTVFKSDSYKFLYYDEKRVPSHKGFVEPTQKVDMKFSEFTKRLKEWKPGEKKLYLQQALNDTVGQRIVVDFIQFNWSWVNDQKARNQWGELTNNLLLLSQDGNVTPCHFDEQENFFCQVMGDKKVILFGPEQFENLYPYPCHHPCDRQSMVDFDCPDYDKFPNFRRVEGQEAVLRPGDVLYLPMYWFHHFESPMNQGPTMSITFWYKGAKVQGIEYPLKAHQKVAMMRNIEKMITEALGDHREVGDFLRTMVLGRYQVDP